MSDWTKYLPPAVEAIKLIISGVAAMVGESTDTVRARVLAELAKPEADGTDTEADAIDELWPETPDQ